jgi:hypothetical protein
VLFALGIASILWAFTAPLPRPLRLYFCAQLVQGVVGVLSYVHWGNLTNTYLAVYSLTTAPILATALYIGWQALQGPSDTPARTFRERVPFLGIPLILAAALCREAYPTHAPDNLFQWVNVIQAFLLAIAGMLAGYAAPYCVNKGSLLVLGTLWVAQAVASLGYSLHLIEWQRINSWLPASLCIVAFSLVGVIQRLKAAREIRASLG